MLCRCWINHYDVLLGQLNTWELKHQRRRRLRKRHRKREVALLQTLSHLFHLVQFVKCWHFFLELSSKILYQSSGKEKESRYLVFTSSAKREIRALVHRSRAVTARKCAKKRDARAKLFFSANITNCFLPFLLTSPSSMLKLPLKIKMIGTLQSVVHRQVQKTNNKQVWRAS